MKLSLHVKFSCGLALLYFGQPLSVFCIAVLIMWRKTLQVNYTKSQFIMVHPQNVHQNQLYSIFSKQTINLYYQYPESNSSNQRNDPFRGKTVIICDILNHIQITASQTRLGYPSKGYKIGLDYYFTKYWIVFVFLRATKMSN